MLITSQKKKHLFLIRSAKFRERIEAAVSAAQRASKIALQKADIAISRTSTARGKAELADMAAMHAREDAEYARIIAKQLAPDFQPSEFINLKNCYLTRERLDDLYKSRRWDLPVQVAANSNPPLVVYREFADWPALVHTVRYQHEDGLEASWKHQLDEESE